MSTQTYFIYGTDRYLVDVNENVPQLRQAVAAAKANSGGWVIFSTPDGGQANIYIQPQTEVKIIREQR